MITDEQIEFWERCGWKYIECRALYSRQHCWVDPDDESHSASSPPIDLNNLKKYAMPKALEKYDLKMFSFCDDLNDKIFWFVHAIDRITDEVEFANVEGCEELEDALFEVLQEVMKK